MSGSNSVRISTLLVVASLALTTATAQSIEEAAPLRVYITLGSGYFSNAGFTNGRYDYNVAIFEREPAVDFLNPAPSDRARGLTMTTGARATYRLRDDVMIEAGALFTPTSLDANVKTNSGTTVPSRGHWYGAYDVGLRVHQQAFDTIIGSASVGGGLLTLMNPETLRPSHIFPQVTASLGAERPLNIAAPFFGDLTARADVRGHVALAGSGIEALALTGSIGVGVDF
ncbi:MAG: hypothetical protein AAF170_00125 [Bacteroidota bacterium]